MTAHGDIGLEHVEDPASGACGSRAVADEWCHHRKLIAAILRQDRVREQCRQPSCNLEQHAVAHLVAETVVDQVEVVEVEQEQCTGRLPGCEEIVEVLHETGSPEQTGERVVSNGKQPRFLCAVAFGFGRDFGGDVVGHGDDADDDAVVVRATER